MHSFPIHFKIFAIDTETLNTMQALADDDKHREFREWFAALPEERRAEIARGNDLLIQAFQARNFEALRPNQNERAILEGVFRASRTRSYESPFKDPGKS